MDEGIKFLNKLYKDMYLDETVSNHSKKLDKPVDKIDRYLDRLEEAHDNERKIRLLKQFYYDKYVIKEENIPESYYKLQQQIYLERGYGHVNITAEEKHKMAQSLIENQKKSLDIWIDYLSSSDALYPMWAKYWAFRGMLTLGVYNKKTLEFNKRTKETTAVFAELNREVLALTIDNMMKYLNREETDESLKQLLTNGIFSKLYAYTFNQMKFSKKEAANTNKGVWVKYNQGSDHMPLVNSLKGYGTGWCTVGEETAKSQLAKGDFYVYYSYNENNEPKIPRIAIRMEGGFIGEVRGVAKNQNIEPEMEEIVDEKLNEFPDKENYNKKVSDMRMLTEIYNIHKERELTKEELRFLYEIDKKIDGFGYGKDPRIEEIINGRNIKNDLVYVLDCKENEIGTKESDIYRNNIVYYHGDLDLRSVTSLKRSTLPKHIRGNLDLRSVTSLKGVTLPKHIRGDLDLRSVTSLEGATFPTTVGGFLVLSSVTSLEGVTFPTTVGGSLYLQNLRNLEGVTLPTTVGWSLILSSVTSLDGVMLPTTVKEFINLPKLKSVKNCICPISIKDKIKCDEEVKKQFTFVDDKKYQEIIDKKKETSNEILSENNENRVRK